MRCLKNAEEVSGIALLDRAFHYGDGCFSTARIRHGQIELYERHRARLMHSCERLALNVDLDLIQKSLVKLTQALGELNGTLKILISRGEGQRGYSLPEHPADVWVIYYPKQLQDFHYEIIQAGVAQQQLGLSMPNLVGLKTLNRLEQVLLKKEADEKGWDEALVCDVQHYIAEGVSSNCFIRLADRWICPELRYNGVHGVMRAEILARMQQSGVPCEQRSIDRQHIAQIQSLFFCNALQPMKMVSQLDQQCLDTDACIELFHLLQLHQM